MAFGKQPTASEAVQQNKSAILLLLAASAPVEYHEILRECAVQAHGLDSLVGEAIDQLLVSGKMVRTWEGPLMEGDDGYYSYDLAVAGEQQLDGISETQFCCQG